MGHEVIGDWLVSCMRAPHNIDQIIALANELLSRTRSQYRNEYAGFELFMDHDEVRLQASTVEHASFDDSNAEDMSVFDDEQQTECGLDDFIAMLGSWQAFIASL
ncbi:Uncharacterised protein [BD1-7 clade bacterium]|uniref:Uncharacterized protein n=1 Tax=BD1-7 clade bacterium TaxID=2029982 RepID=A0A5S9PZU7_9GAMM|nr:Uncharacterised protein [BD1-7 clade bacterium]CAA0112804.1 Uncharacterised protein [BD1-7 clade bacterium]